MTTQNEALRPTATEPRVVDHDCLCRRCGYNLRTLLLDGQCPECGALVAGSWGTPTLLTAPRDHLVRLLVGTVLMVVATATFGVLMLALTIAAASGLPPVPFTLSVLVIVAGAILFCSATGLVLLTRRDPRFLVDPACTSLRLSLLAALCAGLAAMSALPLDTKSSGQPLVLIPAAVILLILLFLLPAQIVGHVAHVLTQLALPRAARRVEWLFPGHPFLLFMLLSAATTAVRGDAMGWLPWFVGVVWATVWLCAFGTLCAALWSALRSVNAGR